MSAKPRGQGLGAWGVHIEHRANGEMIVRADVALGAYPDFITDRLEHWARVTPDQLFLAERGPDDAWREVTYAQALAAVRALGQALIDHDLGQDRPLAILSANDIDQALLTLAAQYVGVPAAPVSPPYSLIAEDFQRLTRVIEQIGPGLVFVAQGAPSRRR